MAIHDYIRGVYVVMVGIMAMISLIHFIQELMKASSIQFEFLYQVMFFKYKFGGKEESSSYWIDIQLIEIDRRG